MVGRYFVDHFVHHFVDHFVDAGHKASSDGIGIALIECVEDFLRKYTKIETTEQTHIL